MFQANRVWKYKYDRRQGFRLARRSPAFISSVFRGVGASTIDAAVVNAENGDIYLFSGEIPNTKPTTYVYSLFRLCMANW